MTVRALDSNGDIVTNGTQFISGVHEVAQTVQTRLKLFLTEYFRDTSEGTPWMQQILGKGATLEIRESLIKQRILQTQNVNAIFRFDSDFDLSTRQYSLTVGIVTPFGQTVLEITDII